MKHIFSICLLPMMACLSAVEVPNTFVDGEPAYASEVNENFETLKDAINATGNEDAMTPFLAKKVPFNVTYSKNVQAPGTIMVVGGLNYRIIKLPITDPKSGVVYHMTIPMWVQSNGYSSVNITIKESANILTSSLKIDGFNAFAYNNDEGIISFSESSQDGKEFYLRGGYGGVDMRIKINGIIIQFDMSTGLGPSGTTSTPIDYDLTNDGVQMPAAPNINAAVDSLIDLITITEQL